MSPLDWVSLVILSGSAVGFFLALVLFNIRRPPRLSHQLLGGFIAAYSLSNTGSFLSHSGLVVLHPHLFGLFMPAVMLVGPFLYLYVLSLTVPGFRLKRAHALHLLPFLITEALFLAFFYFRSAASKADFIAGNQAGLWPVIFEISLWARIPVLLGYLAISGLALRTYARTVRENFSALERVSLNWLKLLVAAYGVGFVAVISLAQADVPDTILHIAETIIILVIGLRGMTQPEIFSRDLTSSGVARPPVKYERSALTAEQAERAERLLLAVMENDKLYLKDDLSLADLAAKIGMASSYVSQVLNERLSKSFYDFVNGYRIEEARRILRDPRRGDQKILSVAFDCGFASKAAFNRVFKRHCGLTPTEYKAEATTPSK